MGMPINSILNRMKMDGATDPQIAAFGGSAVKKTKVVDDRQIMPRTATPSKKLKPFHWAKLNSHQTDKAIWKDAERDIAAMCKQIDFEKIESLFGKEPDG